ncbi:hypothetical protein Tco_0909566 [Tanacetum coccineum]|uniref:Uncharacterized protein n=1 Tax=Tanacetum coccineum TaxID=301880 RepID=A0ABQ5CQD4_9ASTR
MKGLVILFGAIPAIIPVIPEVLIVLADPIVAPEVGTVFVISPTRVLDLVDYLSSSDSDPSEDSLPLVSVAPMVLPFLCSDDSESDTEIPERHVSPTTSIPQIYIAPILPAPSVVVAPSSDEGIPIGRLYRTHLGGPCRALTERKSVRPLSSNRLALSETFRRWRSASLSTPYPPTTSESSLGSSSERSLDSSSPSSGPSRKRCRSPTTSVPSPTHVSRSIAPTPADLLPPHKRFRDSYSPKDSREEHIEVDTADAEAIADVGISDGVVAHTEDGIGMGVEIAASDVREDDEEFEAEASAADTRDIAIDTLAIGDSYESSRGGIPNLEDTIYDIVHYMSEVRIARIIEIKTTQRQLETSQLVASGEKASLVERIGSLRLEYLKVRVMLSIERDRVDSLHLHMALSQEEFHQNMTITRSGMTSEAIKELVNRRVEEALAAYEATRAANGHEAENQSQNGSDDDNGNGGNRNGRDGNGGVGNDGNRYGGNGNPNGNNRDARPVASRVYIPRHHEVSTTQLQGNERSCRVDKWNSHKRTIRVEAVFSMSWRELMKLMAEVYYPRNEIQKMEP